MASNPDPVQQSYVQTGGGICPNCDSNDLTGVGSFEADLAGAWQQVACENCGATWVDLYDLTGYTDLETP